MCSQHNPSHLGSWAWYHLGPISPVRTEDKIWRTSDYNLSFFFKNCFISFSFSFFPFSLIYLLYILRDLILSPSYQIFWIYYPVAILIAFSQALPHGSLGQWCCCCYKWSSSFHHACIFTIKQQFQFIHFPHQGKFPLCWLMAYNKKGMEVGWQWHEWMQQEQIQAHIVNLNIARTMLIMSHASYELTVVKIWTPSFRGINKGLSSACCSDEGHLGWVHEHLPKWK